MREKNNKNNNYEYIIDKYPTTMNKEQLRVEAHISKATAKRLLDDGLIPCLNNGKKTRNITISTNDVIHYLLDRNENPWRYRKSKCNKFDLKIKIFEKLKQLSPSEDNALQSQLLLELSNYNDLMTAADISELLDYPNSTIVKWCSQNKIKKIIVGKKFVIPKIHLVEFLTSCSCT